MSIKNSANGSARTPKNAESAPATPKRTAGISQDAGHILAQIPSVETQAGSKSTAKRRDGRLISQTTSMKMIFGVGIGLVVGAILPFFFGRGRSQPVKELPTWNSPGAQATITPATARTADGYGLDRFAGEQGGRGRAAASGAAGNFDAATASRRLSSSRTEQSFVVAAAGATQQQPTNMNQNIVRNNPLPGRGGDPRALQADNRSDPSAGYRSDPSTGYRGDPSTAYRNDPRYDYRNENPNNPPPATRPAAAPDARDYRYENPNYPPAAQPQGNPLMPAAGAGASYRDQPGSEPGVARFEGTVTNPPGRTN